MQGIVNYWNEERGYGFIKSGGASDYFFHISAIEGDENEFSQGCPVEFEGRNTNGQFRADVVKLQLSDKLGANKAVSRKRRTDYTLDYDGDFTKLDATEMGACLNEVSEWKLEAKLEDAIKYFLPVPESDQIKSGKKSYVIGRKGTGKTAIVSYLSSVSNEEFSSEKLSFKNFPFNELYRLDDQQYTKPNQYITLWKYIIYSTVVRMMAQQPKIDPLLKKKIRKVYPEPNASDLKGLLKKWTAGDFSVSILGSGFSFANFFSRKSETTWVERVDHLEEFIKHNCDTSTYLIMFDELDEDYKEMLERFVGGGYIHLLTSLFKAVQDIRSIMDREGKRIFPVVFLRDDIFDLITDADKTKWRDLTTSLDWTLPKIKSLLKYRIEKSAGISNADFLETWHSLFDNVSTPYAAGRKSLHSLDFITRSTQGRPRDYIHYLQVCAESQLENGGGRIDKKTVVSADKTYSNYLKSELSDEIHGVIPDIANVFRVLSQIRKWILSVEEFTAVFDDYVEKGLIQTQDSGFVLQTLFYFSVVGNVSRNHQVHIFRHEHPEAVLNFSENLVIHRGLMKSLQIL